MRAAQRTPNLAELLAIAELDTFPPDGKLTAAISALPTPECFSIFQESLLQFQQVSSQRDVLFAVFDSLLSRDRDQPETLARWLQELANHLPDPDKVDGAHECMAQAIGAWSKTDPRDAANFALAVSTADSSSLSQSIETVCANWGENDPASALNWAKTLPDADVRKFYALQGVFAPTNTFDLDEAKACVEQMVGANEGVSRLAGAVAYGIFAQQTDKLKASQAAVIWAQSLPATPVRRAALESAATAWVRSSNEGLPQAIEWANALPAGRGRGTSWGVVASAWEGYEYEQKADRGRDAFVESVSTSQTAVNAWLNSLPAGADQDEAFAVRDQWEDSIKNRMIWR